MKYTGTFRHVKSILKNEQSTIQSQIRVSNQHQQAEGKQVQMWLNTVLRAVSGNSRDGECFNLDKQTWRRKSNGKQKTISQNLLVKILWYLEEFLLLSYFR